MSLQTSNLKTSQIPLSQIRRPIPPVLDHAKIESMVSTMKGIPMSSMTCSLQDSINCNGQLPPIDVMQIKENDNLYYFAFGGCHRFQAYDKIAMETNNPDILVNCKLIPSTRNQLRLYLGQSVDTLLGN
ncbi:hypothetical protein KAFR_0C03950 [Kazachstania africana CBS 2517]|uniref:Sulfiredoxin n=1 Tax=Kazachstania africana (strain ATCC 22294 / BCRC 22015 / CBS 2517 / CECT 1963 / NBRC 1671 / NRRL Y-8276) TaxID=1071382 RepID=H2ASN6_KAZAF|nr:hypothetical protein KAFR_0C03950 [Kazachstania africana CBS 2517]CCF57386.1 hypothetical protein KAFR_0C03950 [Kazachstania africana CBS 2517]